MAPARPPSALALGVGEFVRPPDGVSVPPGTSAALLSRLSESVTFLSRPPPIPPDARMDAKTSSFPPEGLGRDGDFDEVSSAVESGGGAMLEDGRDGGGGGEGPTDVDGPGAVGSARAGRGGGGGAAGALFLAGIGGAGGGPEEGAVAFGVFGGRGGGGGAPLKGISLEGGGGGTDPRLGGGGGNPDGSRSLWKGGGTPNLGFDSTVSSIGVLGGRGGGGGPGFAAFEAARDRGTVVGPFVLENLPASGRGGGARNLCGGRP